MRSRGSPQATPLHWRCFKFFCSTKANNQGRTGLIKRSVGLLCAANMSSVFAHVAVPSTSHCLDHAPSLLGRALGHVKSASMSRRRVVQQPQAVAANAASLTTEAPKTAKAASSSKQASLSPEVGTLQVAYPNHSEQGSPHQAGALSAKHPSC